MTFQTARFINNFEALVQGANVPPEHLDRIRDFIIFIRWNQVAVYNFFQRRGVPRDEIEADLGDLGMSAELRAALADVYTEPAFPSHHDWIKQRREAVD